MTALTIEKQNVDGMISKLESIETNVLSYFGKNSIPSVQLGSVIEELKKLTS